jgi:signal transduction histidine kinase/CheY-like chemotaxis protein
MKTHRRPRHTDSIARRLALAHRHARQLRLLQEVSHHIAAVLDVDTVLERLVQVIYAALSHGVVSVALIEADRLVFRSAAAAPGVVLPKLPEALALDGPGLSTWAARHAEAVLVGDVASDARYLAHDLLLSTRSELVAPMIGRSGVIGVIDIQSDRPYAFDQHDLEIVQTLAEYAATAIENARRYQHERLLVADLENSYDELLQILTELQRKEEQLERTARLRALGELASGVAHDFNNLLAGILGNVQLLLLDEHDPERRHMLSVIEQAAQDGAATVRRIQEFARQREERLQEPVNLVEVIEGALAITRPRWHNSPQRNGGAIHVRREISCAPMVYGNASELRELLINLIINAVDAMPHGGELTLRLTERPGTADGSEIRAPYERQLAIIEVADTGIGIPQEIQGRIFDSFFSTKAAGQGSGLGLAICKTIANRHGGRIEVSSTVGRGTTFRVLLPISRDVRPQDHALPAPGRVAACRVLVVDDEPAVREVLTRILQRSGHQVTAAASGEEALEHFAPGRYDLVFTDLGMPGMGGAALLGHLRARDPHLIAVVITGWGQLEEAGSSALGVAAVVPKPFSAAQITWLIGELLGSRAVA